MSQPRVQNQGQALRRAAAGFTLIELLAVIATIALVASLLFPITRAVNRTKILSLARAQLAELQAAIEAYKTSLGHYPPDSPNPTHSQLLYELAGTKAEVKGNNSSYTTLDGSATILDYNLRRFFGVEGLVNSSRGSGNDDSPAAASFLPSLKPDRIGVVRITQTNFEVARFLIGYPWARTSNPPFNVEPLGTALPGLNPWRYRTHTDAQHPTLNNPEGFDLWLDLNIGGTIYRVCNWSTRPLKVTTSLDS